jgi:hypothetical protein
LTTRQLAAECNSARNLVAADTTVHLLFLLLLLLLPTNAAMHTLPLSTFSTSA